MRTEKIGGETYPHTAYPDKPFLSPQQEEGDKRRNVDPENFRVILAAKKDKIIEKDVEKKGIASIDQDPRLPAKKKDPSNDKPECGSKDSQELYVTK
jgi:hypothetical protein